MTNRTELPTVTGEKSPILGTDSILSSYIVAISGAGVTT